MFTTYFTCDTAIGQVLWRQKPNRRIAIGQAAGTLTKDGYLRVMLQGVSYPVHHIVWFFAHGKLPTQLDHKNGCKTDNAIHNLREVTTAENAQNYHGKRRDNQSGFLGVSKNGQGWRATIRTNGVQRTLGTFQTPEEAHKAYVTAKRELHPYGTL